MKPLPKGWHELTIQTFHKYYTLISKQWGDSLDLEVNILACMRGCTTAEIEALKMDEIKANLKALEWLKDMPTDTRLPVKFKCGGHTYKAALTFKDQSAGQFMNFSQVLKDVKPEDYVYHLHELIACMCSRRERGIFIEKGAVSFTRYKYDGYAQNAEVFLEHLPFDKAYPFYVFFCAVIKNLSTPTQDYLRKELRKLIMKQKTSRFKARLKALVSIGGGSRSLTPSATTTLLNGKPSQK